MAVIVEPEQVEANAKRVLPKRDQELRDLAIVLSTREGRRFMCRVIAWCKTNQTIWEQSARIHYNAGQQDVGHWLAGEIRAVDPEIQITMIRESNREEENDG